MTVEAELAAAGIIVTSTEIIISRDVRFGRNFNVVGDMTVAGNNVVTGDLFIGGEITGELAGKYYLPFIGFDVSGANTIYIVPPTDGDGNLSAIRYVLTTALTVGDATLTFHNGTNDSDQTVTVTQAASAIGDAGVQVFATPDTNIAITAGTAIKLTSGGTPGAGVLNGFFEITRT